MTGVGFVGLGAMGLPMAEQPRRARLCGPRLRHAAGRAARTRRRRAATRADARGRGRAGADVLVLMVVNAAQAEAVLFAGGALDAPPARRHRRADGDLPAAARSRQSRRASLAAGRRFVDARSRAASSAREAATLTIMAAAPASTSRLRGPCSTRSATRCSTSASDPARARWSRPSTSSCAASTSPSRPRHSRSPAKVGVDLRRDAGDPERAPPPSSWMLKDRGPRMLQAEPRGHSAVDIFVKDLGIVLRPAATQGGPAAGRARPSDVPRDLRTGRRRRRRQPGHPGLPALNGAAYSG